MDDEYFTFQDLLLMMKVSDKTLRKEMREGKLRYLRMGRQIRFTRKQIDDYVASQTVAPAGRPARRKAGVA